MAMQHNLTISPPNLANKALIADIQYLEPYGSRSFNRQLRGVISKGVYVGFDVVAGQGLNIVVQSLDKSAAAVEVGEHYLINIRQYHPVTLAVSAGGKSTVILKAFYDAQTITDQVDANSQTKAAELLIITDNNIPTDSIILAEINVPPAATQITQDMIDYSNRNRVSLEGFFDRLSDDTTAPKPNHWIRTRENKGLLPYNDVTGDAATDFLGAFNSWFKEAWVNHFRGGSIDVEGPIRSNNKLAMLQGDFGIGNSAVSLPEQTDINSLGTESGFYKGVNLINAPDNGHWFIVHIAHNDTYQNQQALQYYQNSTSTFNRTNNNGTWSQWQELSTVNYVKETIDKKTNAKGYISFIFDDGFASHAQRIYPEFKKRNLTCGFALMPTNLGEWNRATIEQMLKIQSDGFEILNHSLWHSDLRKSECGYKYAETEINGGLDQLTSMGFNCAGYVAAYSVIHSDFSKILTQYHDYAFIAAPSVHPNSRYKDKHNLHRHVLVSASLDELKNMVDEAVAKKEFLCFYEHDIKDDVLMQKLRDILDYCQSFHSDFIEIVNPAKAISQTNYSTKTEPVSVGSDFIYVESNNSYEFKVLEYDNIANLTIESKDSALLQINGNTGYVLVQNSINVEHYTDKSVTFSIGISKSTGVMHSNNSVGINIYNGSTRLSGVEQSSFIIDEKKRRVYVSYFIPHNATSVVVFLRLYPNSNNITISLDKPILQTGFCRISNTTEESYDTNITKINLQQNELRTDWTDINLSNALGASWKIEDAKTVVITRKCKLRISLTVANTLPTNTPGLGFLRVQAPSENGSSISVAPIVIQKNSCCGKTEIIAKFVKGNTIKFSGYVAEGILELSGNLNSLEIGEL